MSRGPSSAAVAFLEGDDGAARLAAAVACALAAVGAPTRPGGVARVLAERWTAGEPLTEDTDWLAPLGPFRDTSIVRGTLGELLAARLTDGRFGLDVVVDALVPEALPVVGPTIDALDPHDLRQRCRAELALAIGARGAHGLAAVVEGYGRP